jgi:hypothetical protein
MGGVRTVGTVLLGFLGAAIVAVLVTVLIYNVPGDTQGIAIIAGIVTLAALVRAVTHSALYDGADHEK